MPLTKKQVNDVCNVYGGAMQCRYLAVNGQGGNHCIKKNKKLKAAIDKKTENYIKEEKKHGNNPWSGYTPIYDGGTCKGFIMLSKLPQGKK